MRIVINDYLGHGGPVQLSRALAARGHNVLHLYCADVQSPKADLVRRNDDPPNFDVKGLSIGAPLAASGLWQRSRQEKELGRLTAQAARAFSPHVVMAGHNPLGVQAQLHGTCAAAKIRFVYWLQEILSVAMDDVLRTSPTIVRWWMGSSHRKLERRLLAQSDVIIPITEDFLPILDQAWGIDARQCMVVRNWASLDHVAPETKDNPWSRAQGITDRKVVLYTGAVGFPRDSSLLVALAERLRDTDAEVLIVSEGPGAAEIAREATERRLTRLRVLPYQPYAVYSQVLAGADILVGLVSPDAGVLSVPSKIPTYLCAGRAIVLAAPSENLAADLIRQSDGGIVVPAGDPEALANAVRTYLLDEQKSRAAGTHARTFAADAFDIGKIAPRFERLFERIVAGPPRRV